eukprot:COSAG04_NODE_353_length_16071_cov_8.722514_13_plen_260_part_00
MAVRSACCLGGAGSIYCRLRLLPGLEMSASSRLRGGPSLQEPASSDGEPFPSLEPFPALEPEPSSPRPPSAGAKEAAAAAGRAGGHGMYCREQQRAGRADTARALLLATLTLYGSQLYWLGAWTMVDVDMITAGVPESHERDVLMTVGGVAGLVLLDRWYEEAGIPGSFWWSADGRLCGRWAPPPVRATSPLGKALYAASTLATLACSILFWVGIFNLVDDWVPAPILNSTLVYVALVFGGFGMMLLTGTLFESSGESA